MQLGQLHNAISQRPQGAFPSDTEKNPREQANAVTLRSGTKYEGPTQKSLKLKLKKLFARTRTLLKELIMKRKLNMHERRKRMKP